MRRYGRCPPQQHLSSLELCVQLSTILITGIMLIYSFYFFDLLSFQVPHCLTNYKLHILH